MSRIVPPAFSEVEDVPMRPPRPGTGLSMEAMEALAPEGEVGESGWTVRSGSGSGSVGAGAGVAVVLDRLSAF